MRVVPWETCLGHPVPKECRREVWGREDSKAARLLNRLEGVWAERGATVAMCDQKAMGVALDGDAAVDKELKCRVRRRWQWPIIIPYMTGFDDAL